MNRQTDFYKWLETLNPVTSNLKWEGIWSLWWEEVERWTQGEGLEPSGDIVYKLEK